MVEQDASANIIVKIAKEVINRTPSDVMESLRSKPDPKRAIMMHAFNQIDDGDTGKISVRGIFRLSQEFNMDYTRDQVIDAVDAADKIGCGSEVIEDDYIALL